MSPTSVTVRQASSASDIAAVKACFEAYTEWLDEDISFQNYAAELAGLPGKYAAPAGALLLAVDEASGEVLGCVAMRPIDLEVEYRTTERRNRRRYCEMKRLYVYPKARGRNVARMLINEVMRIAMEQGYDEVLLDTLLKMGPAIKLYRTEGFVEIEPYYHSTLDGVKYFAKKAQIAV
jgi:ribosomal protein S18 acetylase RimI-like enzyme